MQRWTARPADGHTYRLAEGPVWDGPRDRLVWVEIEAGAVHTGRLTADGITRTGTTVVDRTAGTAVVGADGGLLVAGTERLWQISPDGTVTEGPRILPEGAGRRLNDGKCDPDGVFLVGSMRLDEGPGSSAEELFRVGADRSVTVIDRGLSLSNGLGWSPDRSRWYSIDTIPQQVHVWAPERELFLDLDVNPDGMCVDAVGDLWIAIYGSGEVRRYSPDGTLTGVVSVDEPQVTCPAFAGPELDRLVITTRSRLFIADVGVRGQAATPWAGFHS